MIAPFLQRLVLIAVTLGISFPLMATPPLSIDVGIARINVTPKHPIRLNGYDNRTSVSKGIEQPLWIKALAIGNDQQKPVLLLTIDARAIPATLVESVASALDQEFGIPRERIAICYSHSQSTPALTGTAPFLLHDKVPVQHQEAIDHYTLLVEQNLKKAARLALANRQPAQLAWGKGQAHFSKNRQDELGPVDPDLPVMVIRTPKGKLRALLVNYACPGNTLDSNFNQICGDWIGYAQEELERNYPGTSAMITIGCSADLVPSLRGQHHNAKQHGITIAKEVSRILQQRLAPVRIPIRSNFRRVMLPRAKLHTPSELKQKAQTRETDNPVIEPLREQNKSDKPKDQLVPYPIQTWSFGSDLAMVFLAGGVSVDYALRLKQEFDGSKLWIHTYANSSPGFLTQKTILKKNSEGFPDQPSDYRQQGPFLSDIENRLIGTVQQLLPYTFYSQKKLLQFPAPQPPQASLNSIRVNPTLRIQLVASEPLVQDPVAIDFGPDGKLWVVEMNDYPSGPKGNYQPGGRVIFLEDLDGDQTYDRRTLFIDKIPFPTGVMAWGDGALICAAPEVFYAEDTDEDGYADMRQVLLTGFNTTNYQTRVNGLSYGLDNWVHGSPGLLESLVTSTRSKQTLSLGAKSFRFIPRTGQVQATSGRTQHGRVRDNWGNWFGNNNSALIYHYPLADHYLQRNHFIVSPDPAVHLAQTPDWNRVYPISRTLQRFNHPQSANRITSACSPLIYRDQHLGPDYVGNAFVCESVHNLITRLKVKPEGVSFSAKRARAESKSEFLASTDNWSRFVQIQTGPNGNLWVVDMYRFVIEHPRWITPDRLAFLNLREGAQKGRIYRVSPRNKPLRTIPNMKSKTSLQLVQSLASPHGWQRDVGQRLLVERKDLSICNTLEQQARSAMSAETRLQSLATLDGLEMLSSEILENALRDSHPHVRRHAIRLSERHLAENPTIASTIVPLIHDPYPSVRLQAACTLGEFNHPTAANSLGELLLRKDRDPYLTAAALSSVNRHNLSRVAQTIFDSPANTMQSQDLIPPFIKMATAFENNSPINMILASLMQDTEKEFHSWQLRGLTQVLDILEEHTLSVHKSSEKTFCSTEFLIGSNASVFNYAYQTIHDPHVSLRIRTLCAGLLARQKLHYEKDLQRLIQSLDSNYHPNIQKAAIQRLSKLNDVAVAKRVINNWDHYAPSLRSQILETTFYRDLWLNEILQGLHLKHIPLSQINLRQRHQLSVHPRERIRKQARQLFAASVNPDRQKIVTLYRTEQTEPGNSQSGEKLFNKHCSVCHQLNGTGKATGPDLAQLTDTSPEALRVAVLDPNRAIEPKYVTYSAVSSQGLTYQGILHNESGNNVTIIDAKGIQHVLQRTDLESFSSTSVSLMPEGFEKELSPLQMSDIFTYIQQQGFPQRRIPGNSPRVITPSENGTLILKASEASLFGSEIELNRQHDSLTNWKHSDNYVTWDIVLPQENQYELSINYALHDLFSGNAFSIRVGNAEMTSTLPGTGTWDKFHSHALGLVYLPSGKQRLVIRALDPIKGIFCELQSIKLIPTP